MSESLLSSRARLRCMQLVMLLCFSGFFTLAYGKTEFRCDTLVASGNPEYPPMLWHPEDDPGTLTGAVPALLREIVEPLGIDVVVRDQGSWARVLHMARLGEIDVVAGAFLTDERRTYLDYAQPPITWSPTTVWVARGKEFKYRYWSDLRGKLGSTLIGNSFGQDFDQFAENYLAIEGIRTIEQSFRMAKLGRVDYVLYEHLQGRTKLTKMGMEDEFVNLIPPISSEALYFAFPKRSACNTPAFREAFARRMAEVTEQRRIDDLSRQYSEKYLESGD